MAIHELSHVSTPPARRRRTPPKSAKRSTFSHKVGQKWSFRRRVRGWGLKKSTFWAQKVHFWPWGHPQNRSWLRVWPPPDKYSLRYIYLGSVHKYLGGEAGKLGGGSKKFWSSKKGGGSKKFQTPKKGGGGQKSFKLPKRGGQKSLNMLRFSKIFRGYAPDPYWSSTVLLYSQFCQTWTFLKMISFYVQGHYPTSVA